MSIPPGSQEYPQMRCPKCRNVYRLTELEISDKNLPEYSCPTCKSEVYKPKESQIQ